MFLTFLNSLMRISSKSLMLRHFWGVFTRHLWQIEVSKQGSWLLVEQCVQSWSINELIILMLLLLLKRYPVSPISVKIWWRSIFFVKRKESLWVWVDLGQKCMHSRWLSSIHLSEFAGKQLGPLIVWYLFEFEPLALPSELHLRC